MIYSATANDEVTRRKGILHSYRWSDSCPKNPREQNAYSLQSGEQNCKQIIQSQLSIIELRRVNTLSAQVNEYGLSENVYSGTPAIREEVSNCCPTEKSYRRKYEVSYEMKMKECRNCTCQPTPRLRIEGGIGVALAYLDAAINVPVDCLTIIKKSVEAWWIKT